VIRTEVDGLVVWTETETEVAERLQAAQEREQRVREIKAVFRGESR
jgi:hypothetical protein